MTQKLNRTRTLCISTIVIDNILKYGERYKKNIKNSKIINTSKFTCLDKGKYALKYPWKKTSKISNDMHYKFKKRHSKYVKKKIPNTLRNMGTPLSPLGRRSIYNIIKYNFVVIII